MYSISTLKSLAETKTRVMTTESGQGGDDHEKNTKEPVTGHRLGHGDHDLKKKKKESSSIQTPLWKTEMMMKIMEDDKKWREPQEMTKQEGHQQKNLRQSPEKAKEEDHNKKNNFRQNIQETNNNNSNNNNMMRKSMTRRAHVWDCGSTLYDSFELNSFQRQLDSAISSSSARSISMPHLPDRSLPPPPLTAADPPRPPPSSGKKHYSSNKISRSIQKLLKSMFKSKQKSSSSSSAPSSPALTCPDPYYDKSESLTTIPESAETDHVGPPPVPGMSSLVRKTASERFTAPRLVGISCA